MRAADHEHRVMVRAGEACAGEGDEVRAHAGRRRPGDLQQAAGRGALGERRRVAVGFYHGRQGVAAPGFDQQVGAGADHPGNAHRQGPGQGDDADQVVQVQPAQARGFVAHFGEAQFAHEGRIEHHAGDDRQHEEHAHEGQQQLARQTGEQVYVQAQHQHHEAAVGRRHLHCLARARVEHEGVRRIRFGAGGGGHDGDHAVGFVFLPAQVLHHLAGAMTFAGLDQLLQVQVRRAGGHLAQLWCFTEQVFELVVEDQRQAGERQEEQEQGADQAGPGMDNGPAADGGGTHEGSPDLGRACILVERAGCLNREYFTNDIDPLYRRIRANAPVAGVSSSAPGAAVRPGCPGPGGAPC